MKTILVASSKGGAGKTTLATNLAAYFALDGKRTVLVDADPQHSSTRWAERRAELESAVLPIDASGRRAWRAWLPEDAERVVVDAPAGAMADDLGSFLEHADAVVVPVLPSALDIEATVGFLNSLAKVPRVHKRKLPVGLVVNRSKPWTNAADRRPPAPCVCHRVRNTRPDWSPGWSFPRRPWSWRPESSSCAHLVARGARRVHRGR